MKTQTGAEPRALASPDQVEALADRLSACADAIHARVMKDIRAFKDEPVSEAAQAAARALLDDEMLLRQRANALYADAATLIVKSLSVSQRQVLELTAAAAEKIRKIGMIGSATGLIASLLGLAGAAASARPEAIILALESVGKHIQLVDAHRSQRQA